MYRMPQAPLSDMEKVNERHVSRKIFLTVVFFFVVVFCAKMPPADFLYHATAAFFLSIIVVTDLEQYIIFDLVLLPFAFCGIFFDLFLNLPLVERLVTAFCATAAFFVILLMTKNGIGGGDVKLVGTLGLWLGAEGLTQTVLTASILGGLCAFFLLITGRKCRSDYFAYGPYFCIAAAWQLFRL